MSEQSLALDGRYSINREFVGMAEPQFVIRFCGEWVGYAPTLDQANARAKEHRQASTEHR